MMRQINAVELHDQLQHATNPPLLLDVREPREYEICAIPGSRNIPMSQIPQHIGELDPNQEIVVICHHGMRSQQVGYYLLNTGFTNVVNLRGGIHGWAVAVDPRMARY